MDAKIVKAPTATELDTLVKASLPGVNDYTAVTLKGGIFNTTYLIEAGGKKYILRVGPVNRQLLLPYEAWLMDAECWAYEAMAKAGIPTSTVVHKDTTKTLLDRDFMMVEYIPSRELNGTELSAEEEYAVYREVGTLCRRMNRITGEKFGRVGDIFTAAATTPGRPICRRSSISGRTACGRTARSITPKRS